MIDTQNILHFISKMIAAETEKGFEDKFLWL